MEGYGSESECDSPRTFDVQTDQPESPEPLSPSIGEEPTSPGSSRISEDTPWSQHRGTTGDGGRDRDESGGNRAMVSLNSLSSGLWHQRSQRFHELRRQERELSTNVAQTVEDETEPERRAAEEALAALKRKRQELLQRQDIRAQMQEQQRCSDELEDIGDELKLKLRKLVRAIMRDESLSDEQKADMVEDAHRRAASALMDDEERSMIEQLQTMMTNFSAQQSGGGRGKVRQMICLR